MKTGDIPALTGVRFVAALWVVLFHIELYNPGAFGPARPLVSRGYLGVDLFFLLSGFVLAHNYLHRLGPRPTFAAAGRFLWLRLARVWPLYMVAVLGGGLLLWLRSLLFGSEPNVPLTWGRLAEQVLMVQQWVSPSVPTTSWTGPAWSISAEWLAYLCFPALAVAAWRLRRYAGRGAMLAAAVAVFVPLLVWAAAEGTESAPYMWLGRLASEFSCGLLLAGALSTGTARLRAAGTRLAPAVVVLAAAGLYLADSMDEHWPVVATLALFPLLLVALAYGEGRLHRALGHPHMVLGGGVSFALYLVHVPLIKLFRDFWAHATWTPVPRVYGELGVALLSLALAYLLFRYVEEPARRAIRDRAPNLPNQLLRLHSDAAVDADRLRVEVAVRDGLDHQRSQLLRCT